MNDFQKDYGKKPDTKDYVLYEFNLHDFLKKDKIIGTRNQIKCCLRAEREQIDYEGHRGISCAGGNTPSLMGVAVM